MPEKVAIVTLGCEKNLVDSEIMSGLIDQQGHELVEDPNDATVVIVNTCGFIDAAKEESINTILDLAALKETGRVKCLIVSGCLVQRYKEELMREIPEIDGIVGTGDFARIAEVIAQSVSGRRPVFVGNPVFSYERALPRKRLTPRHFAHVKIAEGCDNACTFCSIPIMRGAFRSRSIESIVREVEQLAAEGVREVILIAQDTSNYGVDLYGSPALASLLNRVSEVEGIRWVRLHYLYPGAFNEELLETIASNPKICKYIDMPLQHSEDRILRRMRRPGRQRDILSLIEQIRARISDVAIRTSIIVGFPGETEEDFENLLRFVRQVEFDRLGVFTYSNEEGTPASRLPDHVPEEVKEERAHRLMELQRRISSRRNQRHVGRDLEVLIESYDGRNDVYLGRTQYDAPEIDGEVFVRGQGLPIGEVVRARITHSFEFDLAGEVL
ncbi:ribosomal protein S12 methylthiotransferase [Planifilum fulgidum]|uniref:Ribosomal protein uS12 methylthiotransferase RimO n=1 Tax=Planifilum fulgidum TaxID=201973 RepID=A0A1I2RT07_9BACL|nr:30S ribosomal protein S12 methylthiotransferase RimO [Planifilum fulgidum]SFG43668.1 ribosomal protein S12 methylthiotransferase [Planifilum fulgidum]